MGNTSPKPSAGTPSEISATSKKKESSIPYGLVNLMTKKIDEIKSRRLRSRVVENFIIIWLDASIAQGNGDVQYTIKQLKTLVNEVKTFTDLATCVDYIETIREERIFLITSGFLSQTLLPMIGDRAQIESIYIFCRYKHQYAPIAQRYCKVKGVYTKIEKICKLIRRDVHHGEADLMPISIAPNTSMVNSSELDPSFLYSQLLKEVLLDMEYTGQSKQELVGFCRQQYAGNERELHIIDDFAERYDQPSPIWWYTRECFIYSMLNKALRTHDIEVIMKMGYVICDLHGQIQALHAEACVQAPFVVYRGQGISDDELAKIKSSQAGLLSFNNFLSTSVDRDIALKYAHRTKDNSNSFAILFQMKIDPSVSSTPFASVEKVSCYANEEQEILFSMHTVFRIMAVEEIEDRLWQVDLTLTSEQDGQLKVVAEKTRQDMQGGKGLHRLCALLIEMGRYEKAEEIVTVLLEQTADDDLKAIADLYQQLANIYYLFSKKHS